MSFTQKSWKWSEHSSRACMIVLAAAGLGAGCTDKSVEHVTSALGGRDAILSTRNEVVTASSQRFFAGEAVTPGTAVLSADIDLTETSLLGEGKTKSSVTVKSYVPFPGAIDFTQVLDGNGGYDSGLDNVFAAGGPTPPPAAILGAQVSAADKHANLFSVLRLVRAGLSAEGSLTDEGVEEVDGKEVPVVRVVTGPKARPIRLYLDPRTGLPTRATTLEDHPPMGDSLVEVSYEDYRPTAQLMLPYKATMRVDGVVTQVEKKSKIALDASLPEDAFAFPSGVEPMPEDESSHDFGERSAEWLSFFGYSGLPSFFTLQKGGVMPEELAPGVTLLKGPSHHSLLIEMKDHLVVVEAPLYTEWTSAVLAQIKTLSPKPLKKIVLSHFHYDHVGGVREFAAESGATVYAGADARRFFQSVFNRPHSVHPDRFATEHAPAPEVVGVAEVEKLTDDAGRVVELRNVPTSHSAGMLMVYLPAEKILFEADLYSPGFPTNNAMLAGELYDAIVGQKLDVERIVGAHGMGPNGAAGVVSLAELKTAAGR